MNIDLDVEPSRPVPDREAERPREPERTGHRREYDEREPRRAYSDRVDAELKGTVAARAERARQAEGRDAADAAQREAAVALGLPVADGKVLFPDAQIEYVTAAGRAGRCNVEVASAHYNGPTVRAKAAAGFTMYATAGQAAEFVRRALSASGTSGSQRGGRHGGSREIEVFEI